ncbi:hypothetical protein ABFG93_22540 (plasmid) [Pseudalkalibacillus hwajinpoensis]|uniref:hypothetical protein n=1 Tax=Guptibacillus hwajinpoensis TaxID=208199 RepID=UPI00325B44BE
MNGQEMIEEWIAAEFNLLEVTIESDSAFPFGKRILDTNGDFMIVFFNEKTQRIMCTFKGAEQFQFPVFQ